MLNSNFSYFKIIKNPIDLSTISAKLSAGLYKDRFGFESDFRLMIDNAKLYNMPGSFAHNEAIAMEMFFEKCQGIFLLRSWLI